MATTDITQTTQTDMASKVDDYSVKPVTPDSPGDYGENVWYNSNFTKWFGYYKKIPELKKAIDFLALWTSGKGWEADPGVTAILENITGWGEDTFESIMFNMIVIKKVNGDAFAEIIRNPETGTLLNLKIHNPASMSTITNKKGKIIRYEHLPSNKKFSPEEILHLCNDRVTDEIHGVSIIESCQTVIDSRNEAMADYRRLLHRSSVRVMEVDEDNKARLANLKRDYAEAINKGELLIIPAMPKGKSGFQDLTPPPPDSYLSQIKYLENFFYQAVGVPKVILGGSEEFTEASSKIAYLTFEQVYSKEQREFEADFWNQVALRITLNKPASLKSEMLSSEDKNQAQTGFQPNDTQAGVGK